MAKYMSAAQRAHAGMLTAASSPRADELMLVALPEHLLKIARRDGAPVIQIQVGDGTVPGAEAAKIDPRNSGDYADRFITGVFQMQQVVYGHYDGTWQLIR